MERNELLPFTVELPPSEQAGLSPSLLSIASLPTTEVAARFCVEPLVGKKSSARRLELLGRLVACCAAVVRLTCCRAVRPWPAAVWGS